MSLLGFYHKFRIFCGKKKRGERDKYTIINLKNLIYNIYYLSHNLVLLKKNLSIGLISSK